MNENMLPVGTMLRAGTYRIEKQISSGGFGNTYVVRHLLFNECRAMKEFFMKEINVREGAEVTVSIPGKKATFESQRNKFMKEAQRLRILDNPHIVKVHDLFMENGTVYYIMDLIDGRSLHDIVKSDGPMDEEKAMDILRQVLDALSVVHNQEPMMLHLDIKPSNIMLDKTGNAFLLDFGSSKQIDRGNDLTSSVFTLTPGYAPSELIDQNKNRIGPWTDLYEVGATLYYILTGHQPPIVSEIQEDGEEAFDFPNTVSEKTHELILWLMSLSRNKRPKSVEEVYEMIDAQSKPSKDEKDYEDETIVSGDEDNDEAVLESSNNINNNEEETVLGDSDTDGGDDKTIINISDDTTGIGTSTIAPEPNPAPESSNSDNTSNNNKLPYVILGTIAAIIVLCWGIKSLFFEKFSESSKIDAGVTELTETKITPAKELENRLFKLQEKGYMIGHTDDPLYGYGWLLDEGKSDIKATVSDYPAIMEFDISGIDVDIACQGEEFDADYYSRIQQEIIAHNKRGGIVALRWSPADLRELDDDKVHQDMNSILPGGKNYSRMLDCLNRVVSFVKGLKADDGKLIPIILHAWDGGNTMGYDYYSPRYCWDEEFKKMWNLCQDYFIEKGLDNLLWCYSIDCLEGLNEEYTEDYFKEFLQRYPGNDRVAMIGVDMFQWHSNSSFIKGINSTLKIVSQFAKNNNKLLALSKCHLTNRKDSGTTFWTHVLKPVLDNYSISYFMVQENTEDDDYYKNGYRVAPSSPLAADFKKFYDADNTLFLNDIKDIQ